MDVIKDNLTSLGSGSINLKILHSLFQFDDLFVMLLTKDLCHGFKKKCLT